MADVTIEQAQLDALHTRLDDLSAAMADLQRARALFKGIALVKFILGALTAGMVGFFTPLMAVAAVVEPPIPDTAWWIAYGGAALVMAKDIRSQLDLPPVVSNGAALPKGVKGGVS